MKRMIPTALLGLAMLLTGCAGGWRNGAPPGVAAVTAPAAVTPPAAKAAAAVTAASTEGVTFVWKGEGESVALAGDFNAWSTTADPLKRQADSSWTLTKRIEPGRYNYKFALDGGKVWKEDPNAAESSADPYGGKNSVLVVGGTASPAAAPVSPAASTAPASKGKAPIQTPDGMVFTFAGEATSVALAGDFNAWAMAADPLVKQADGTWSLTKKLAAGTYEYKFVVDGATWKTDEANPASKADPYGGKNSLVTVK